MKRFYVGLYRILILPDIRQDSKHRIFSFSKKPANISDRYFILFSTYTKFASFVLQIIRQGCIKFPAISFSSPPSFLKNLIFFLKTSVLFPTR